ncbi:MAG: glucose-6-phosphate dehydrogenase (coenzyme-F420) [Actinomycetota bacterium]
MVRLGYKASAEQFAPRELLEFSVKAEEIGLDVVAISDHFQPWRHHGGHGPFSLAWLGALGERTQRVTLATSVLTPTFRYHPTVVAHAFATLACLNPGRVVLGIGAGEAMNERPAIGIEWPKYKERVARLRESVELMRKLWTGDRVTFEGDYYETILATVYDKPDEPIPIYIAAGGPKSATMVGELGDGFICTSGKGAELYESLLAALGDGASGAGRDVDGIDKMIEIKVSYDRDVDRAKRNCEWWAALALSGDQKSGIEDPIEMERLAEENKERAHTRFIVSNDPDEVVDKVDTYVQLGFTNLVFHHPGNDQNTALDLFAEDVLPLMRKRWG